MSIDHVQFAPDKEMPPPRAGRREWIGLGVLMLPTLLIAMDLTVLHLAVPAISRDLQPSSSQLLWIIDIYGFLIAGSLITMGTLGDRIGRRKLLMLGAVAFTTASVVAAFSTSAGMLIAARALLGIAGATLMPSTMSLLRNMFLDPKQRTAAIGIWVSGFSAGSAIGPLIGGALLEYFWWGSVFLLAVPVMVVLVVTGPRLLPEFKEPQPGKFDLLSAGMSLLAVISIIYGVKLIAQDGVAGVPLTAIAFGTALGLAFVFRQTRLKNPFIDLGLFKVPAFSVSLGSNTLGIFALFGIFVFMAQYLQLVAGLSPLQAGLWTLPGAITFVVSSNVAPFLVRRVRPSYVIGAGMALAGAGIGLMIPLGTDSLDLIVAAWVVSSVGMGMAFTLTSDLILTSAPPERAGAAAAMSETGVELGGALGIGIIGSIGTAVYRSHLEQHLPLDLAPELAGTAKDTLGGAMAVAAQLPVDVGAPLLDAAQSSFVDGMQLVAIVATAIVMVAAVAAATLIRHSRVVSSTDTPPDTSIPMESTPQPLD